MTADEPETTEEQVRNDDKRDDSVADQSGSKTTTIGSNKQEPQERDKEPRQNVPEIDRSPPNNGDGGGEDPDGGNGGTPSNPSDEGLHLLTLLWFLEQNDETFEISGFQAKRFYEDTIADSDDVSELYAELKGQFIRNQRDADPFELNTEGRELVRQAEDVQTTVSEQLAVFIRDTVSDDQILRRLLWLADSNKSDFMWYLQEHNDQIEEPLRFLPVVFTDEAIQANSNVQSVFEDLKDLPDKVYQEISTYLEDDSYLIGLATVEGEAVAELLQINTDSTIRCSDSSEVLRYYLEESQADNVIQNLRQVGVDVDRNVFDLDLDGLISQHREELADWLTFDRETCQTAFETNWDLVLEWNRGFRGETDVVKQQLVDVGAVIPQGRKLAVRIETFDVAGETVHELQTKLENRIGDFENVSSQVFFDFEEAIEWEEDILVVLHENSWSSTQYYYPAFIRGTDRSDPEKNIFTKKVVLVPSPRELGFNNGNGERDRYHCHGTAVESPEVNREFNAIGEVGKLELVKREFSKLEWVQADDSSVRRAEELIKQRDQISLEQAFDEIAEYDQPYQEVLYSISAKRTTKTSRNKNNYTEDILWGDIDDMLQTRYPSLSESDCKTIKDTLKDILVSRAGVELTAFKDEDKVYRRFGDQFDQRIKDRLQNLSTEEQYLLATFLVVWGDEDDISQREIQPEFELYHEFWFEVPPSTDHSLYDVLVSTGICSPATYVTSHDNSDHRQIYAVYKGVREDPDQFLNVMDVEPTSVGIEALQAYEGNIPQLAGLEYLIENGGHALRSDLRDHLLNIDDGAWMSFEMIDRVLAEKDDQIFLDPLILENAERWLTEAKRRCIADIDEIEKRLSKADIVDLKIEFDTHRRVYHGHVLTKENEEIQVVTAPWLTESDEEWLSSRAIIVIISEFYEKFFTCHRTSYSDLLIIGLIDDEFEVYRSLPHEEIAEPIIQAFESEYTLLQQEVDVDADTTGPGNRSSDSEEAPDTSADKNDISTDNTEDLFPATTPSQVPPRGEEIDLVGKLLDPKGATFPGDVLRDRPLVIILHETQEDRFGTTVQLLCRELYHQFEGGIPRGRIRGDSDEIEHRLKAGNRIEFIDQSDGEFFGHTQGAENSVTGDSIRWSKIRRRIQELDTQGLGFLLFQIPSEFASQFRSELEAKVRPHRPQIVEIEPWLPMDEYSNSESYYDRAIPTADALWGYPGLQNEFEVLEPEDEFDTFDDIFTLAERRAWSQLHSEITRPIKSEPAEKSPVMAVQPHQAGDSGRGNESYLHYALKVFTVRWLIETKGYTFSSVATETDTKIAKQPDKNLIPDIQVGNTVFEVETLYGVGTPVLAIKETVEKYNGCTGVSSIQLILPPVAGFLHYSDLTQLVHEINETWDFEVSLSVPRLESKEVVSIEQLRQTIEGSIG